MLSLVMVSTRQINTGDSTSSNTGFRCANSNSRQNKSSKAKSTTTKAKTSRVSSDGQTIINNNDDDVINLDEL